MRGIAVALIFFLGPFSACGGADGTIDATTDATPDALTLDASVGSDGSVDAGSLLPKPGDLDPTYGVDGTVVVAISGEHVVFESLDVSGGHATAAGFAGPPPSNYNFYPPLRGPVIVARRDASGAPDPGFGSDGNVVLDSDLFANMRVWRVRVDGSRTLIAGSAYLDHFFTKYATVAALDASGTLDGTFASTGLVATYPPGYADGFFADLAVDGAGDYVLGGYGVPGPSMSGTPAVHRMLPTGEADTTFGTDGWLLPNMASTPLSSFDAVKLQSDGAAVVCGWAGEPVHGTVLQRVTDGAIDPTFGTAGVTSISGNANCYLAVAPDDSIFLARTLSVAGTLSIRVTRLSGDGIIDDTFQPPDIMGPGALPHALVFDMIVQPDGAVLVAGTATDGYHSSEEFVGGGRRGLIARLTPDGSLDASFGSGGVVVGNSDDQHFHAIALQPNGEILVAGDEGDVGIIARYHH